jgi:hypothetical protein
MTETKQNGEVKNRIAQNKERSKLKEKREG